jgi:hypothetical protein
MSFNKKSNKVSPNVPADSSNNKKNSSNETKVLPNTESNSNKYFYYDQMNDANKKAMDVMQKDGPEAAIKHMFTDQETGRQLSYAEMRSRYG